MPMPRESALRIIVLGYIVRGPMGGLVWHHLQYLATLHALGHDVWFLEDSEDYPACYDPERNITGTDPTYGLSFLQEIAQTFGLAARWAYHDAHQGCWHGPAASRVPELARSADLVLNLSGLSPLRDWWTSVPLRVLIDTDPVFTQIRHLQDPAALAVARGHTHFLTFGTEIGQASYSGPVDGLPWQPTRQPLHLPAWPLTPLPGPPLRCTTVMQWQSYPPREHRGRFFGMKSQSFKLCLDLPGQAPAVLELALSGGDGDLRRRLRSHGWEIADPAAVARRPCDYQAYIRGSWAEFGVAKHGYVESGCGWFSERSAAYLASGRAVICQDTGFSAWLPSGEGLLVFRDPMEALVALEELARRPVFHGRKARDVAEAFFDGRVVLTRLLDQINTQA